MKYCLAGEWTVKDEEMMNKPFVDVHCSKFRATNLRRKCGCDDEKFSRVWNKVSWWLNVEIPAYLETR